MLLLASFFLFLIHAQEEPKPLQLPPTFIFAEDPANHSPRSTSWPVSTEKLEETFIQPQIDNKLNSIPGVQARLYQGSPTLSIRGSAQSGRVLSLYNDIPLNFSTGFGPPITLLPKEIIGSTQIIKGPASLFYGSQAMGGSVNFVSKKIERPLVRMTLSDTDNSYMPWQGRGVGHNNWTLASPLYSSKKTHMQTSLFTENDDGVYPYNTHSDSGERQNNDQNTNRATFFGRHKFKNWDLGYDLVVGNQIRQSPGSITAPFVTDEKTSSYLVSLTPELKFSEHSSLKMKPSYIVTNSDFQSGIGPTSTKQETFIFQNTMNVFVEETLQLQFFLDYFHHELDATFNPDIVQDDNIELGYHYEWHLSPLWYLQGGGRFLFDDQNSIPHIGFFYEKGEIKTWISYSKGFRKPTLSDLFASQGNFVANPNLEPESSLQYEWGLNWGNMAFKKPTTFAPRWLTETRLFYIDYNNFIERTNISGSLFTKSNIGKGESYGLEVSQNFGYGPWEFFVNYSFLEARSKETKEPFLLSPKHQLTWGAFHYMGPLKIELQNSFWKNYYDRDLSSNLIELEDWSQWNLIFHSYSFRSVNFSIGVLNIFNENMELTLDYPEPQRRYWAQVTWEF